MMTSKTFPLLKKNTLQKEKAVINKNHSCYGIFIKQNNNVNVFSHKESL